MNAAHPVFAGHFPQFPVMPGALLLASIGHEIEREHRLRVVGIDSARFSQPVRPADVVEVSCEQREPNRLRFRCAVRGSLVAKGLFEIRPANA